MDSGSSDGGGGAPVATAANAGLNPNAPPPFLSKTYDMVDDPATDAVISWGPQNNSFVVWSQSDFARHLLPKYFKHSNFSSFVRQLNTYGFKKVDPDRWEFANEGFLRGQKHLLKNINRRKPSHGHSQHSQEQTASVAACVEVGKFGLEGEIDRLKRDKNVLMQELIRLREQQRATDIQLQTLGKQLQGMERRQQMMMSFLAKAMQSPGLFAQLVQQNESNRRVIAANKKRRLPRQEGASLEENSASSDGQMVKYEPSLSDARASLLAQMLKSDTSSRLQEPLNGSDGILIDNFPSPPETLDGGLFLDPNSGAELGEVSQNSKTPFMAMSSGFPAASSPSPVSDEVQSEAVMGDASIDGMMQDISMVSAMAGTFPSEFTELQELVPDGIAGDVPIGEFVLSDAKGMYFNPIDEEVDGSMPIVESDDNQNIPDIMELLDQYLAASPQSELTEEVTSNVQEMIENHQLASTSNSRCDNMRNMDSLTAQMGLLASSSKG